MPHTIPPRIPEHELFERIKGNLRYLRKEVFYSQGFSTLDIAGVVALNSNKMKRMEDNLRGTINSFLLLLNFYGRAGIDLNAVFWKDLSTSVIDTTRINKEIAEVVEPIPEITTAIFYKNIAYLRRGILKGHGITTKKMEESIGVGAEKILRIEKGGKGYIASVVSLIYFYIRRGLQINALITSDLSAE